MAKTKLYKRIKQRIYPNKEQECFINKTFGCSRKVWNLLLSDYKDTHTLNEITHYKNDAQYAYLKEVDSLALANEKLNLQKALKNAKSNKRGYPHFKNKYNKQSYTTNVVGNNIKILKNKIKLPKLKTPIKVRTKRFEKENGKLKAATILRDKTRAYFISLLYEFELDLLNQEEILKTIDKSNSVGLDLGLLDFLVDSNNSHIKPLKKEIKPSYDKLRKEQRKLSNKLKANTREMINNHPVYKRPLNACSNIKKQKIKIAKLYKKIHNKIKDFTNKLSHYYIKHFDIIAIENLKIRNMLKNRKLSRSIQQTAWGMFTKMLEYKAYWQNKILVKIDTYYPSSKTCSVCGDVQDISLSERVYHCKSCNTKIDRDYNAAINIKNEGLKLLGIS